MNRQLFTLLGLISKAHGTRGEMLIKTDNNLEIKDKTESLFVETDKILVPFFIEHFKYSNNGIIVKFDTIHTPDQANRFLNFAVFAANKHIPTKSKKKSSFNEIENYTVTDTKLGIIGQVSEIGGHPLNPLLTVKRDQTEIFIPINEHFILRIDKKKKNIETNLPDGLIDLNQ